MSRSERWGYLCCGYFSGESYSSKHSLTRGTRPQSSRVSNVVSRCLKFMYQAHVVDGLDGDDRMQLATVSTATIRQPSTQQAKGQPPPSHSVASHLRPHTSGVLPICPLHFGPLQMNGNSGYWPALYANWPGRWPARRAATQERLQVCSSWMNQPMQCARVTEDCVHGRGRRGAGHETEPRRASRIMLRD